MHSNTSVKHTPINLPSHGVIEGDRINLNGVQAEVLRVSSDGDITAVTLAVPSASRLTVSRA